MLTGKAIPSIEAIADKSNGGSGDDDQTVDWRFNVKAITNKFNAELCMIKDGRHHLAGENGIYFEQVLKAIDQHLLL